MLPLLSFNIYFHKYALKDDVSEFFCLDDVSN